MANTIIHSKTNQEQKIISDIISLLKYLSLNELIILEKLTFELADNYSEEFQNSNNT